MPGILNPFRLGGSGLTPVNLTEPWDVIASTSSIVGGELALTDYDFSNVKVLKLHISDITVTTDDSTVFLTLVFAGGEAVDDYLWGVRRVAVGLSDASGDADDPAIPLASLVATRGVGNLSTEGLAAEATIYMPGSTLHKAVEYESVWVQAAGGLMHFPHASALLKNSNSITGIIVSASSALTGGSLILTGLA